MGKLSGAIGYLSGAMEFAKDFGVGWRKRFILLAQQAELDFICIDPTDKPGVNGEDINENQAIQRELQSQGRFKELKEYVNGYRHYDLRFTDLSDFLVVMVDPTIAQWGTANEVYVAESQRKPIFFICEGGLYKFPRWLIDLVQFDGDESNVYQTVEEVVHRLKLLDLGEVPLSKEWVLIRKDLRSIRNRILSSQRFLP